MQEVGSSHSLETTQHSAQQTYLRPLIHTTHNFQQSRYTLTTLNISQQKTAIYLETAHARTTKQLTQTYNTAYSTSQTYNTHSSPEICYQQLRPPYTKHNTQTRVPNTTLQQTSSPDTTTVSNTLYIRTSWTTQHALSSDHLPFTTTINIRYDYRLQQNRRTFTNYKNVDWTQFMEDTESAFAQTTRPFRHSHSSRVCLKLFLTTT